MVNFLDKRDSADRVADGYRLCSMTLTVNSDLSTSVKHPDLTLDVVILAYKIFSLGF